MKVVIFAGGLGTRLSEETGIRPKPLVEIGGKPILWHIMKIYQQHGFNEFVICLGYKGYLIKEYFLNYFLYNSDLTINLQDNSVDVLQTDSEPFKITLIDTGAETKTAGRLLRVKEHVQNETFMLTYGDGVSDVDIKALVEYHKSHQKKATVTVVRPQNRFGTLNSDENQLVTEFREKPKDNWVNGGFFVLEPEVFNFIEASNADDTMWEDYPLENLAKQKELKAFQHTGFWKAMDTLRDKMELNNMWNENRALWM